jgi:hypothetical protein
MLLIALTILGKEDQAERLPVTWGGQVSLSSDDAASRSVRRP